MAARNTKAVSKKAKKPAAAAPEKAAAKKTAGKTGTPGEFGEGNYRASQRFRGAQEAFVRKNKARIPALGKQAEAALEGPEGNSLRAAEAKAAGHAASKN